MNVGGNLVQAAASGNGGDGRIRLDFFGLAGTTNPEYHPGFTGDTGAVTTPIDGTNGQWQSSGLKLSSSSSTPVKFASPTASLM